MLKRVYFIFDKDKDDPLFVRASREAFQLNGQVAQVSNDYIPAYEEEQFERSLMEDNTLHYCLYTLMKIYHFFIIMHDIKILRMGGDFVSDDTGVMWLINISRLQYQSMISKPKRAHDREMSILGYGAGDKVPEETPVITDDYTRQEGIGAVADVLQKKYEELKDDYKFKMKIPNYQEDISDKAFAEIYPNMQFRLSSLLKANFKHRDLRRVVTPYVPNPFNPIPPRDKSPGLLIDGIKPGRIRSINEHRNKSPINQATRSPDADNSFVDENYYSILKTRKIVQKSKSIGNMNHLKKTSFGGTDISRTILGNSHLQHSTKSRDKSRSHSQSILKQEPKANSAGLGIKPPQSDRPRYAPMRRNPAVLKKHAPEIAHLLQSGFRVHGHRGNSASGKRSQSPITQGGFFKSSEQEQTTLRGLSRETKERLVKKLSESNLNLKKEDARQTSLGYLLHRPAVEEV